MDSISHSRSTTSEIDKNSNIAIPSKRDIFLSTYQPHQSWSIPDSIIYYISKNPSSSKIYEKLIQSCKYFFIKNPILVLPCLSRIYVDEWKTLFNRKSVDLKTVSSKLWITLQLSVGKINAGDEKYFISSILPKIYQCDAKNLVFNHQNITFNDLLFLGSKCEEIRFWSVTVKNDDGSVMALEKIVAAFPKVKYVKYVLGNAAPNIITSNTAQTLIENPHFENFVYFGLSDIPECFDIDTFYFYIKKNKTTRISLCFVRNISQQYRNRLQTIVNEIIQTENRNFRSPYIYFVGIDESSDKKLWNLSPWG